MSNLLLLTSIILNSIFHENIANAQFIRGNENIQIINKRDFGTDLQHLVVDRFTGNIFIGARNGLHHLTPGLDIKANEKTGPKNDRQCNYGNCTTNTLQEDIDNVNKVLLIDYNSNRLIVCGTFQGYCFIRSLQDMSPEQEAFHPIVSDSENASTVAFIAQSPSTKNVMYIGVTLDGKSNYGINVPGISARSLEDGQMFTITSLYLTSGTLFNRNLRKPYFVNFVHGFDSQGFSYFVITQQKSSLSLVRKEYISKLLRVCQNDPLHYSFTEVQIECTVDDINYNLVQAAHVSKPGADLAKHLGITQQDDVFYAVFSDGRDNVPSNRSALCVYSLSSVRRSFQKNIQQCYNGIGSRGSIDKPCIWSNRYHIGEDFCGSEDNYPVVGELPIVATPIATFDKRLTAVTASRVNNDTVVYVGTADGHLKKILFEPESNAEEYADIQIHENSPVNADLCFDQNELNLYVMTKNRVTKVQVYNCAIHSNYEQCKASNDPYCGWCLDQNRCSLRSHCNVADNNDHLDPIIIDFYPKSGPISGGTLVTMTGNHFNHGHTVEAFIADIPCVILNYTETEALCRTTPSFIKFTGKFQMKFDGVSHVCEAGEFHFENDPTVTSVISGLNGKKAKGIPSGGIKIYVRGTNFHIIKMPQFFVLYDGKSIYSQCKVLSQTRMECLSPAIFVDDDHDQLQYGDESIKLDFGFIMDDVTAVQHITGDIQKFKLCPSPFYEEFPSVKVIIDEYVVINGKNLDCACEEDDVFVMIGAHPCNVTALSRQQLTCRPQPEFYNLNENQKVTVKVGESLTLDIGFVRFTTIKIITNSTDGATGNISANTEITTPLKKTTSRYMKYFILGVIALILILAGSTIYLCLRIKRERKLTSKLKAAGFASFEEGRPDSINPDLALDEQAELLPYDRKYEFPREKLKLGKQLGAGAFGIVLKGLAHGISPYEDETVVAVKMVKRMSNDEVMKALISELKIMVHLGQHLNIVNLLGAVTRDIAQCNIMVIVEYCQHGSLQTFLMKNRKLFIDQIDRENDMIDSTITTQKHHYENIDGNQLDYVNLHFTQNKKDNRSDADGVSVINSAYNRESKVLYSSTGINSANTEVTTFYRSGHSDNRVTIASCTSADSEPLRSVTTTDLLCWAFQITRGMQYLNTRKVIHGDLAARNILLSSDNVVKICDFGLARSLYKTDIYRKEGEDPLPVKWLALESISDHVFSTKTDVWSFGIVLWELFSLGKLPYPGMSGAQSIYSMLKSGYRMEKPPYATENIYDIMLSCWRVNPESRPMFDELEKNISVYLESDVVEHYIDLNEPYLKANINDINAGKTDYIAMMGSPDFYAPQMPNYVNVSVIDEQISEALTVQQISENSPDVQFESESEEEAPMI